MLLSHKPLWLSPYSAKGVLMTFHIHPGPAKSYTFGLQAESLIES
jgi:hypothetical protein